MASNGILQCAEFTWMLHLEDKSCPSRTYLAVSTCSKEVQWLVFLFGAKVTLMELMEPDRLLSYFCVSLYDLLSFVHSSHSACNSYILFFLNNKLLWAQPIERYIKKRKTHNLRV